MHPILLFLLAILTPFLLGATLLLPAYAGFLGAVYMIYLPASGAHPLAAKLLDPFYIIEVYGQVFTYWLEHREKTDLVHYTLPLLGLPLLGTLVALYVTYRIARGMLNVFHLSASR